MNNQERPHALFSPSKLPILAQCSHFVGQADTSAAAERGIEIHETIISAFLSGGELHYEPESAALYKIRKIFTGYQLHTWQGEVHIPTSIPHVSGYADLVFYGDGIACIIELKTGWADRGHCKDSLQIKALALGLLEQGYETVAAWLIEADKHTDTSHSWIAEDIPALRQEILNTISSALQPTVYKQGGYCMYCAKAIVCPEIENTVTDLTEFSKAIEEVKSFPPVLVAERLNLHYDKALMIEKYIGALKARAMAIIEAGGEIAGWHIKETGGTRTWLDEMEAAWQISEAYPQAVISELISPAKAEKALKEFDKPKAVKELLAGLTKQATKKSLERAK